MRGEMCLFRCDSRADDIYCDAAVVFVGNRAGRKLSEISDIKFERLCGFMFITMAVMKLS